MLAPQELATLQADRYLAVALGMQRWRDFAAHICAYLVVNSIFIGIWATQGNGLFWPIFPLFGWGLGLSFQHFHVVLRGQITDAEVRRHIATAARTTASRSAS